MINKVIRLPLSLHLLRQFSFPHKIGILDRLYGYHLAGFGKSWVSVSPQFDWKLDLTDPTQRWIVYDVYENKNVINWMRSWFSNGGIAIETGPNIGQTLLYYADLADRIVAIEPLKSAIDWLQECIDHNQLNNITLLNNGISNKPCVLKLQQAGAQSTFRTDWYTGKNHPTTEIQCYPLDEMAKQQQIERVRLWKLDVEGMDFEALEGAENLLAHQQIDAIYIEISSNNYDKSSQFLKQHGYDLFNIDDNSEPAAVTNPAKHQTCTYLALPNNSNH